MLIQVLIVTRLFRIQSGIKLLGSIDNKVEPLEYWFYSIQGKVQWMYEPAPHLTNLQPYTRLVSYSAPDIHSVSQKGYLLLLDKTGKRWQKRWLELRNCAIHVYAQPNSVKVHFPIPFTVVETLGYNSS